MKNRFGNALVIAACGMLLWGAGGGRSTVSAASPAPVRLAVIVSLTGSAADDGAAALRAARLAAEKANRSGGIHDRPLALRFIDNQSTPIGSKQAAELAVAEGVMGVIGPFRSSHAAPSAAVLQQARVPMITPIATHPHVTRIGDCIFRMCMTDAFQGRVMARFAHERLGARTAVVFRNISEEYSITLADMFTQAFVQAGGAVVGQSFYKAQAVDFSDGLAPALEMHPDVIFVPGYAMDSGLLILQAANMGVQSVFLGGDGWGEPMRKFAGEALRGAYYTTHYHPDVPFEQSRHLQQLYRTRFNQEVERVMVPLTYDAVLLFVDAARRAATLDRESIRRAIAATHDFSGASGTIAFDENGDPKGKAAFIIRFEKDRRVLVDTMVQ